MQLLNEKVFYINLLLGYILLTSNSLTFYNHEKWNADRVLT